ncbi:G2 and S phase-expressed protein 1 [Orycteropus afer afer]|uniref:G2 and S phase-expressed protein 1 n=1 Tax=Orycteropus afer afer TaxID=1230840 RepID=A0A8B7B253_ORYAF|nr:G2 and S phase-expressed protein 1 [Orycteropus afer afer]
MLFEEVPACPDILLLADEKFDFDLSLSSSSANEDEDVFSGPVDRRERCLAASSESNGPSSEEALPASGSRVPWSPLAGETFAQVCKEAHLLALQIKGSSKTRGSGATKPGGPRGQGPEIFVQESKLKINLFEQGNEMKKSPTSLKRETYYLSESPLMGPPHVELQPPEGLAPCPGRAPAQASLTRTQQPRPSARSSAAVASSAAHRPSQAVVQRKTASRLPPPRASLLRGRSQPSAAEKPKRERPASPSRMKLQNNGSRPEEPAAALDAGTMPAGRSHLVPGKRTLPGPAKLGLKRTLLKPPGRTGCLAKKASSSGPILGATSSVADASAGGQGETVTLQAQAQASLQVVSVPSIAHSDDGMYVCAKCLRRDPQTSLRTRTKSADGAEITVEPPKGPSAASLTLPQTPDDAGPRLDSTFSLPASSQVTTAGSTRKQASYLDSKTKVMPTPTSQGKIPKFSVGESPVSAAPRCSRAQRPQSCTSAGRVVHSTPVRRSSGPASQSLLPSMRTPVSTKRALAMPTPASHRLSGLPLMTPRTLPRARASPQCVRARRLSSEPRQRSARNAPAAEGSRQGASRPWDSASDDSVSPPSAVPQALRFSPEKSDFPVTQNTTTEATVTQADTAGNTSPDEAVLVDVQLDQLTIAPKAESTPLAGLPLLDLCGAPEARGDRQLPTPSAPLGSGNKPLIDLMTNTPDMNREVALKPSQVVGQLIDLASPLIQLSPAADKENVESPLLKF